MRIIYFYTLTVLFLLFSGEDFVNKTYGQDKGFTSDTLQEVPYRGQVIKTNPLALLWSQIPLTGEFRLMYEQKQSTITSSLVSLSYIFKSPITSYIISNINSNSNNPNIQLSINGLRLQGMQRFYIFPNLFPRAEQRPEGIYLAPHFSINSTSDNFPGEFVSYNFINANILGGLQFFVGPIAFDIYAGLGYRDNFRRTDSRRNTHITQQNITQQMNALPMLPPNLKINFSTNIGISF